MIAFVDSTEASTLMPALSFHFARDLPVLMSSQALQDLPAERLGDFRGVWISEIPWQTFGDGVYEALAGALLIEGNSLASLYALGADGLLVARNLAMFEADPDFRLLGSTGRLAQTQDRQLHRMLDGAVVEDGALTPAPPAN